MRKFLGLLFLGGGERSAAVAKLLHKRLDEGLALSGGLQQSSQSEHENPSERLRGELELEDVARDIVAALVGRGVVFTDQLAYPWPDDFGLCAHGKSAGEACRGCGRSAPATQEVAVKCDASNNPPEDLEKGVLRADVTFRPHHHATEYEVADCPICRPETGPPDPAKVHRLQEILLDAFGDMDPQTLPLHERAVRIANAMGRLSLDVLGQGELDAGGLGATPEPRPEPEARYDDHCGRPSSGCLRFVDGRCVCSCCGPART